jgi:hypothetical protein
MPLGKFVSKRANVQISRRILRELADLEEGNPTWVAWVEDKVSES